MNSRIGQFGRLMLLAGALLIASCGGSTSSPSDDNSGGTETSSTSNSESVCTGLAAALPDADFSRPPVEDMDLLTGWDGYAYHHTHVHNEGVGKWYLYADDYIEVRAPADGRICRTVEDGDEIEVGGNAVLEDSSFDLFFGENKWIGYGHIMTLKSIKDAYDAAGDEGIEINEGDLLGYTWAGGAALDFQITDQTIDNGLPENAPHVKNFGCPMNYYEAGSDLESDLIDRWYEMTYQVALDAKETAEAALLRSPRQYAELADDTCSAINVNTMNYGTIWGNWYNESGESTDDSLGTWYHYIRGTVTLLPNSLINPDTYTVGFAGEDGLWSEMRSNMGVGTPWMNTDDHASLFFPDGVSEDDTSGCFVLSMQDINWEPLWIYFELTVISGGDDLLDLTKTTATTLNDCIAQGQAMGPSESFSRYPDAE